MKTLRLLVRYGGQLVRQWGALALLIIDIVAFALGLWRDIPIPQWAYWATLATCVLWASFKIYAEQEQEKERQRIEYEKKMGVLQSKLGELESARPKLELHFQADQGFADHRVLMVPPYPDPPNVREEIEKVESKLGLASRRWSEINQLEYYLEKYKHPWEVLCCRALSIGLAVDNTGMLPAHNVIVCISFPDELQILSIENFLSKWPPEPTLLQRIRLLDSLDLISEDLLDPYHQRRTELLSDESIESDIFRLRTDEDQLHTVSYELNTVMHNVPVTGLEPFFVVAPETRQDRVFDIPYEIHSAEMPKPTQGTLMIEIRYETQVQGVRDW